MMEIIYIDSKPYSFVFIQTTIMIKVKMIIKNTEEKKSYIAEGVTLKR